MTPGEVVRKEIDESINNMDIPKEFLGKNAELVMKMMMHEWLIDDALSDSYEEGREDIRKEVAKRALAEGASIEFISRITGLDIETIRSVSPS